MDRSYRTGVRRQASGIVFKYVTFEFDRPPLDPMSEAEYESASKDFYNFYHDFIDKAEVEFQKLKNPHAFSWKFFWIKLGAGILFLGLDYGLKEFDYYDAGEVFAFLSFFPLFWIVLQPIQWLLSKSSSGKFSSFENDARNYFLFHYRKMRGAKDYNDYRVIMMRTTDKEFSDFDWEEEAAIISEHESPVLN